MVPSHWPVSVSCSSELSKPREAEVAEVGVVAGDQDVGGLDVAVHEPGGVRGVERRRHLRDDLRRPLRLAAAPRA